MVFWGRFDGWVLVLVVLSTANIIYPGNMQLRPVNQIAAYFRCSTAESGDFLQWTAFVFPCTRRSQSTMLRSSATQRKMQHLSGLHQRS
jgi:hypothetical protein